MPTNDSTFVCSGCGLTLFTQDAVDIEPDGILLCSVCSGEKDTNPKDGVGIRKWRQYATVPMSFVWGIGVAMLEGARKYGRHNYRKSGVRASVYVDAAKGHIDQFWEGEDIDKDSQLHHLLKAGASLAVLYDGIANGKWVDDRPPKMDLDKFRGEMQTAVDSLFEKYPDAKPPITEKGTPDA